MGLPKTRGELVARVDAFTRKISAFKADVDFLQPEITTELVALVNGASELEASRDFLGIAHSLLAVLTESQTNILERLRQKAVPSGQQPTNGAPLRSTQPVPSQQRAALPVPPSQPIPQRSRSVHDPEPSKQHDPEARRIPERSPLPSSNGGAGIQGSRPERFEFGRANAHHFASPVAGSSKQAHRAASVGSEGDRQERESAERNTDDDDDGYEYDADDPGDEAGGGAERQDGITFDDRDKDADYVDDDEDSSHSTTPQPTGVAKIKKEYVEAQLLNQRFAERSPSFSPQPKSKGKGKEREAPRVEKRKEHHRRASPPLNVSDDEESEHSSKRRRTKEHRSSQEDDQLTFHFDSDIYEPRNSKTSSQKYREDRDSETEEKYRDNTFHQKKFAPFLPNRRQCDNCRAVGARCWGFPKRNKKTCRRCSRHRKQCNLHTERVLIKAAGEKASFDAGQRIKLERLAPKEASAIRAKAQKEAQHSLAQQLLQAQTAIPNASSVTAKQQRTELERLERQLAQLRREFTVRQSSTTHYFQQHLNCERERIASLEQSIAAERERVTSLERNVVALVSQLPRAIAQGLEAVLQNSPLFGSRVAVPSQQDQGIAPQTLQMDERGVAAIAQSLQAVLQEDLVQEWTTLGPSFNNPFSRAVAQPQLSGGGNDAMDTDDDPRVPPAMPMAAGAPSMADFRRQVSPPPQAQIRQEDNTISEDERQAQKPKSPPEAPRSEVIQLQSSPPRMQAPPEVPVSQQKPPSLPRMQAPPQPPVIQQQPTLPPGMPAPPEAPVYPQHLPPPPPMQRPPEVPVSQQQPTSPPRTQMPEEDSRVTSLRELQQDQAQVQTPTEGSRRESPAHASPPEVNMRQEVQEHPDGGLQEEDNDLQSRSPRRPVHEGTGQAPSSLSNVNHLVRYSSPSSGTQTPVQSSHPNAPTSSPLSSPPKTPPRHRLPPQPLSTIAETSSPETGSSSAAAPPPATKPPPTPRRSTRSRANSVAAAPATLRARSQKPSVSSTAAS